MYVMIVGGGNTGSALAKMLLDGGHTIKIVEERTSLLEKLMKEFPKEIIFSGDGSSPSVLEKAGVRDAMVLAAVTRDDETNLVITSLARFEFNVPRTIARVNNPKNAWLFTAEMGVDVALNQAEILAHLIAEEMSLGDMMTLLKFKRGEYSLVEEKVFPTAFAAARLPPLARASFLPSAVFAETRVTPFRSSMTCTYMWFSERYTLSLGRSAVPRTFLRMRLWTRRRVTFFDDIVSMSKTYFVIG
jgi:trk system potassium uptake protein TrkA